jgi:hypothetical protein
MKFLKYFAILPLALSVVNVAQAHEMKEYTLTAGAPQYNIQVPADSGAIIKYSFDPYTQTVHCVDNNYVAAASSVWMYNGQYYYDKLPITLKDDSHFQGSYANPTGHLIIDNNSKLYSMNLTCDIHNM